MVLVQKQLSTTCLMRFKRIHRHLDDEQKTYDHLRIAFRRLRILIADYFTFLKTRCDKTYVTPFFFHSLNYWQKEYPFLTATC